MLTLLDAHALPVVEEEVARMKKRLEFGWNNRKSLFRLRPSTGDKIRRHAAWAPLRQLVFSRTMLVHEDGKEPVGFDEGRTQLDENDDKAADSQELTHLEVISSKFNGIWTFETRPTAEQYERACNFFVAQLDAVYPPAAGGWRKINDHASYSETKSVGELLLHRGVDTEEAVGPNAPETNPTEHTVEANRRQLVKTVGPRGRAEMIRDAFIFMLAFDQLGVSGALMASYIRRVQTGVFVDARSMTEMVSKHPTVEITVEFPLSAGSPLPTPAAAMEVKAGLAARTPEKVIAKAAAVYPEFVRLVRADENFIPVPITDFAGCVVAAFAMTLEGNVCTILRTPKAAGFVPLDRDRLSLYAGLVESGLEYVSTAEVEDDFGVAVPRWPPVVVGVTKSGLAIVEFFPGGNSFTRVVHPDVFGDSFDHLTEGLEPEDCDLELLVVEPGMRKFMGSAVSIAEHEAMQSWTSETQLRCGEARLELGEPGTGRLWFGDDQQPAQIYKFDEQREFATQRRMAPSRVQWFQPPVTAPLARPALWPAWAPVTTRGVKLNGEFTQQLPEWQSGLRAADTLAMEPNMNQLFPIYLELLACKIRGDPMPSVSKLDRYSGVNRKFVPGCVQRLRELTPSVLPEVERRAGKPDLDAEYGTNPEYQANLSLLASIDASEGVVAVARVYLARKIDGGEMPTEREITGLTDIAKSTVHRHCVTLEDSGLSIYPEGGDHGEPYHMRRRELTQGFLDRYPEWIERLRALHKRAGGEDRANVIGAGQELIARDMSGEQWPRKIDEIEVEGFRSEAVLLAVNAAGLRL
jgi:hypothetical protein